MYPVWKFLLWEAQDIFVVPCWYPYRIEADDDAQSLASRLSAREHALMVSTVDLFCQHSVKYEDDAVSIDDNPLKTPLKLLSDGNFETQ